MAGFDRDGYPISPGGTVLRPPPGQPPVAHEGMAGPTERPEEPAKYVYEVPKLPNADVSTSAVGCGNWVAQIRQIFVGLSPTASVWWSSVERAADAEYQRWLIADPLDRLLLDPGSVRADFDLKRFQRVESRAVTMLLAAIAVSLKEESVSNRWH